MPKKKKQQEKKQQSDSARLALTGLCARCFKPASKTCTRCKTTFYCSEACQAKDWQLGHKIRCGKTEGASEGKAGSADGAETKSPSSTASSSSGVDSLVDGGNELAAPDRYLHDPERVPPLFGKQARAVSCGLINMGNTCFANAVLQCLTHTSPLQEFLVSKEHSSACKRMEKGQFCMFCLMEEHVNAALASDKPFLPARILKSLKHINDNFCFGAQEDAHEFSRCVIRAMQDASVALYRARDVDKEPLSSRSEETTIVHQLFAGYLRSQLRCKCGHTSNSYESFLDLSLEISEATDSLQETLESFTAPERLDGANKFKCPGCATSVRAEKRLTIHEAPNILTVQLKRFRLGFFGKINKAIAFPLDLSLRPYMSPSQLKANGAEAAVMYRLYAVLVHLDMFNISSFGHYICYVRDPTQRDVWWKLDDSKITQTTTKEVLALKAYMLFYERSTPQIRKDPNKAKIVSDVTLLKRALSLSLQGVAAEGDAETEAKAEATTAADDGKTKTAHVQASELKAEAADGKTSGSGDGKASTPATPAPAERSSPSPSPSSPTTAATPAQPATSPTAASAAEMRTLCPSGDGFYGTPSTRGYCSQCFARKFPDEHKSLQEQKRAELIKAGKLPPDSAKPTSPTSGSSSNGPIPVSSVAALLSLLGLSGRVHVGDGVGSGARDRERDPLDDDGLDDGDEQIEGAVRVGVHAAAAGKGASADGAKANGAGTGNSNGDKDKGSFSAELEAEREAKRREIIERLRAQGKLKGAPPSPAPAQSPAAAAGAALDSASKPKPPDSPPVPAPAPASMSLAEAVSSAGGKIGPAPPKKGVSRLKRNDMCPCGSGQKFKKCHGKDATD